jgi:hypothetical protein
MDFARKWPVIPLKSEFLCSYDHMQDTDESVSCDGTGDLRNVTARHRRLAVGAAGIALYFHQNLESG